MAGKQRKWLSLPKDEKELQKIWMKTRDPHPALKMAYDAIKMKRSPKQAFILLLGLSGAGKSSTINYLFGKNIAPTSDLKSETRSTTEYVVSMKSDEWMIPDLSLSIIDTPGFCDTEGLEQDAKNMVSINDFQKQHSFLCGKFPNLVFLIINIQDNRIEGSNSHFSKMLRGLGHIKAVDQNNPNLVVVMTHAASIARSPAKWKEKVEKKTMEVSAIVQTYLGITPEVVVQENQPEDFDLDQDGDWHILPNGAKQPKQLFEACKRILNTSKDELGHEAVAVCFRSESTKTVNNGMEVVSFNAKDDDVRTMYSILLQAFVAVSDTEVCRMLDQYNKDTNIVALNNDILILKCRFRDLNITEARDLQSSSMNKIKARMIPVHLTSRMEKILGDAFGLKYEQMSGHVCHMGKGYNVFNDSQTQNEPLILGSNSVGKLGFPEDVLVHECCLYEVNCRSCKDRNEYVSERLHEMNISSDADINIGSFTMKVRGGYNIKDSSTSTTVKTLNETSFSIEQKTYKLSVKQPYKLNEDLKKDITDLPSQYDAKSENNVNKWKWFFEKWGYHVVTGAYLGGSVTGQMRSEGNSTRDETTENLQLELSMKLSYLNNDAGFSLDKQNTASTENTKKTDKSSTTLQWIGGDRSYFRNSLEQIGMDDWENWRKSLEYNPEPLWTSLELYPIHQLAEQVNKEKALEMKNVFCRALGGKLKYEEPQEENRNTVGQSNSSRKPKCFPGESTVFLFDGKRKRMKDVLVGDQILTADSEGRIIEDEVIAWIHKVEEGQFRFLKVSHEYGTIIISDDHILYVGEAKTPRHASMLQSGEKVYFTQNNGKMSSFPVKVTLVEQTQQTGLYAPLTRSGSLLVDGLFVSCYCTLDPVYLFGRQIVSAHDLAHLCFLPLRLAHNFGFNISRGKIDVETGIHQYAKWLMENALGCLKWINGTF